MTDNLLSSAQVARRAGVTTDYIKKARGRGAMPDAAERRGHRYFWRESDIDAWLESRRRVGRPVRAGWSPEKGQPWRGVVAQGHPRVWHVAVRLKRWPTGTVWADTLCGRKDLVVATDHEGSTLTELTRSLAWVPCVSCSRKVQPDPEPDQ